jgi:hypothetical protein
MNVTPQEPLPSKKSSLTAVGRGKRSQHHVKVKFSIYLFKEQIKAPSALYDIILIERTAGPYVGHRLSTISH